MVHASAAYQRECPPSSAPPCPALGRAETEGNTADTTGGQRVLLAAAKGNVADKRVLFGKWLGNEEVKDSFGKQLMSDLVSHSSSSNPFVGHFFNVLQYVSVQFLLPPPKPPTQQYVSGFDPDLDVQMELPFTSENDETTGNRL
jgi:hypothetical protein